MYVWHQWANGVSTAIVCFLSCQRNSWWFTILDTSPTLISHVVVPLRSAMLFVVFQCACHVVLYFEPERLFCFCCTRVNVANLYSVKDSKNPWPWLAVMVIMVVVIKLIINQSYKLTVYYLLMKLIWWIGYRFPSSRVVPRGHLTWIGSY